MFKGLEHTAIASPDPERLAQWYADYLDFVICFRYAGNVFVRAANGGMLEIIPSEGERDPQNPKKPGLRHLAIEVADFEAACGQLESKGIQFFDTRELEGTRLAFFDDADGNILHLVYRDEPI